MKDDFTKEWITANAVAICSEYDKGILTLRSLHYQLVGLGMTNDIQHYKRVVKAMIDARWEGLIEFDQFSDLDRGMIGETRATSMSLEDSIAEAKDNISVWMTSYYRNRWENQPIYPEVFIEKKALQGVFERPCRRFDVALGACKGYPSLTFLNEAQLRYSNFASEGKRIVMIYFGDYDPSGEDIPRSMQENFSKFGVDVEIKRIALMKEQVIDWGLPPAPAKVTDTRTAKWDGLGQVELDAVKPEKLMEMCENAIQELFDEKLYTDLMIQEREETVKYRSELKDFVNSLYDE